MASYATTLTSTLTHPIVLCYRMPKEQGQVRANPILEVPLPPRALNVDVVFPNEVYYHEFKMQNEEYFKAGKIIEGKATEKQAIDINAKNSKKETEKSKDKVTKSVEKIKEISKEKVSIEVKKDEEAAL